MHVDESMLASVRERYGLPAIMEWKGEISDLEWSVATHNPARRHDVTLFILDPQRRLALIRKPQFAADVWRPPGGGIHPGEDFGTGAVREALEETGLRVELRTYLVDAHALFGNEGRELAWRTHVLLAETRDTEIVAGDPGEIEDARWGTLDELAGPLRERLLATGRAFWRYRVALHDAALQALRARTAPSGTVPGRSVDVRSGGP
jgi:8-oxo-dGTP pyrophosphatase MutT (NUDIX family)